MRQAIPRTPTQISSQCARFVEYNFGLQMGGLTFADARSTRNLAQFYNLSKTPRPFVAIPAPSFDSVVPPGTLKLEPPDDD
ncbi:MAG TPA: hypothetical protein VGF97_10390 [Rhizomicrobium sp.]|jgi:hypothetical protein